MEMLLTAADTLKTLRCDYLFFPPTDYSVVTSRTPAAVMFRNSLKMLLTGGKANRKSRSSGESLC